MKTTLGDWKLSTLWKQNYKMMGNFKFWKTIEQIPKLFQTNKEVKKEYQVSK